MEVTYEEESALFSAWCWIVTGFLWMMLLMSLGTFLFSAKRKAALAIYLSLAAVGYFLMLINSFTSSSFHFLSNPIPLQELANTIRQVYQAPPITLLRVECYHYEKVRTYKKTDNGSYVEQIEHKKMVTHTAVEPVHFLSYRDISDSFVMDARELDRKTQYVKLRLKMNITYYNDGTQGDYLLQVQEFKRRHNFDQYQDFSEETKVHNFQEYMLIPLSATKNSYVGSGWYTLFALLSGTEIYKRYINQMSAYTEYTFVKQISTRTPNLFSVSTMPQVRVAAEGYDSTYKYDF